MKEPTHKEFADAMRSVAMQLLQVADATDAMPVIEDLDWQGEWSTHTLAAYNAIYESITH